MNDQIRRGAPQRHLRISKGMRWWIFLFNAAYFLLSIAAELIVSTSRQTTPLLDAATISSMIFVQLALFAVTILVAFILTAIFDSRDTLVEHVDTVVDETNEFRENFAQGIVQFEGQAYRSLRYIPSKGSIYYGGVASDNRNILFNNETLKRILQTIQAARCGAEPVIFKGRPLLYAIGYAASERFAVHFQQHMESENQADFDLGAWLSAWTKYDSNAGFGRMVIQRITPDRDEAEVVIYNSFLTHGSDYGGPASLCEFMTGYIEGLLKNFRNSLYEQNSLNREGISVTHDATVDCYHSHQDTKKGCVFTVRVPKR